MATGDQLRIAAEGQAVFFGPRYRNHLYIQLGDFF
jgi:hypothetical protein